MGVSHYIILMLIVCSLYWAFISLMDMLESKKRLKEKKEVWGKLNEVSEKLRIETGFKVWESLGNPNKKKEDIK